MRQLMWIIGYGWINVKVKCKSVIQWEVPKKSRDLITTALKAQLIKRD